VGIDRPSVHFYPEECGIPAERGEWENGRMGEWENRPPLSLLLERPTHPKARGVLDGTMIEAHRCNRRELSQGEIGNQTPDAVPIRLLACGDFSRRNPPP